MRTSLAVPCGEVASFSGSLPLSTRERVAYVDVCGLALLDPRTLRVTQRWLFTELAGWQATSDTVLVVRYIQSGTSNAGGPSTMTLLVPPGAAPEVTADMERKVRLYSEGTIPQSRLNNDSCPVGSTLSIDALRDARTLPFAPLSAETGIAAGHARRGYVDRPPSVQNTPAGWAPRRIDMDADEIFDDTEDVDDATIVKPRADTFATIRAAFRTAAGPSSSVKPASIVHRLKSTGALGGGGGGATGGGEFRTPKVMNQTSPESHRRMHQMSAYQRKVMSNAVGAWQSVGTTLSDTPLDEHAVRAAWERREWARQAEEAAAAAARREEDERAARLERGPEPPSARNGGGQGGGGGGGGVRGHRLRQRLAADGARRAVARERKPPSVFEPTPSREFRDAAWKRSGDHAPDEWPGDEGDFFYDVTQTPGGAGTSKAAAVDEEEEEDDNDEDDVNRRVRGFADVVKESLARVGRAGTTEDVDTEVAALINRLRRFAAEG